MCVAPGCSCAGRLRKQHAQCPGGKLFPLAAGSTSHCMYKGALKWLPREGRQRDRHKNINTFSRQYKYFLQTTPAWLGDALLSGVTSRDSLGSGKLRGSLQDGLTALTDIKEHKWETEVLSCQQAPGRGRCALPADTVSRGGVRPTAFCVLLAESLDDQDACCVKHGEARKG